MIELYEQCQLHNNQATASLSPSLPRPHTAHACIVLRPQSITRPQRGPGGQEKAKRQHTGRRSRAVPLGGSRCIPLTRALEKAGRPVCSMFQDRLDITHRGGTQKPWSLPPTRFWLIGPSRELRPDSSPETVPVCLEGCGETPVRCLEASMSCLELWHSGWAMGWGSALASGAWAGQWPLKTQVWMHPPGAADGKRMLGPFSAWAPLSSC